MTTSHPNAEPWLRTPKWFRDPRVLEITTLVLLGLIATVDLITIGTDTPLGVANELVVERMSGWQPGGYIALAVSVAGIALAWRYPWPGLVVAAVAPLTSALLGWDPIATWNLAIFATFLLTLRALPGLPAGLLVGVVNYVAVGLAGGSFGFDPTASIAGISALVAAGAGSATRGHQRYWAELERRTREAITTREAEAQRRVAQERVRIARDLHDMVGHEVALVSMHLGAAEVHLPAAADAARADLAAARTGVQSVLLGTQQILEVLRSGPKEDPLAPVADYTRLPDLVTSFRDAGLEVEATLDAPPELGLARNVSAAVFRIVQEALTNAQRHGTGTVSLRVDLTDDAVTIETVNVRAVTDRDRDPDHGGYGLVGMRERAASVGGRVDAQADGHLFWVRALLPADGGRTQ